MLNWKACATLKVHFVLLASLLPAVDRKPNVVLVITDDQGYGDIAAHGNTKIRTPNLDELHSRSIRLTNFHVDPTCSPTRSALMSGRYSTRTGVWHTIMGRSLMRGSEVTIAEVLKRAGYATGMFGKWHLGENYPLRPHDQGFDEAFYHGGGGVGQGPDAWGNDYFDDTYFRNGKREKVKGYCTDVWFENASRFIERNKDKPFFAYISTNAPHGPYLVAEKYSKPYADAGVPRAMSKFYGMITNIDENVGRLRKKLEELGIAEDTIFVFMTDNGTAAGVAPRAKTEWRGFNCGMRGRKGSEFDGGHRVPFFIHWPKGKLTGPRDVDQLTAHIDVLPTLAQLCGVERGLGPALDGQSLVSALRGDAKVLRDRTLFVHSQRVPDPIKWRKCAVLTERWRLVNGKQLFDMRADPGQRKNVAVQHPEQVAKLRTSYEGWWKSLEPEFPQRVRIGIGSPDEPRTQLHPHDWHVEKAGLSSWHQNHVRRGHLGNGFWAIAVERAGRYAIELRRWPEGDDRSLEATKARIRVGDVEREKGNLAEASSVRFEVELKQGPARMQTWLTTPKGKTRGAYFVYVERLDG